MAKLRPRARIVRTIGDQLISGPEAALIELVKNSFDADSPAVSIAISPADPTSPNYVKGRVQVNDRGHGMTASDLVNKWFEPATSDKVERRHSPGGRRMLGAKGVGRFATARLGRVLHLTCASKDSKGALEVSRVIVDWDSFDSSKYLDEVDVEIQTRRGEPGEPTGVHLDISMLREVWSKKQLELLVRELRRLLSPLAKDESEFRIFLDLSAFTLPSHGFDGQSLVSGGQVADQGSGEAGSDSFSPTEIRPFSMGDVYHYAVRGTFDAKGAFDGTFLNQRGDATPQPLKIEATALSDGESACGEVGINLNVYDREAESIVELFEKLGLGALGRLEARRALDENIGVGIYRAGFRIRPYGDAETDWLELERMRVQNPSRKLGLNQVWGIVDIEVEQISGLVERSSREGLEHSGEFLRLKRLLADLMTRVEELRFEFRQKTGMSRKVPGDTDDVKGKAALQATSLAISALPAKYRGKVERALKQDATALKTAIGELETYQQALQSRSTLGLVVAQVLHDGRRFLADIVTRSKELSDGAPRLMEVSKFGEHYRGAFPKNTNSIQESAASLNKLFRALNPISGRRRGRPTNLDIKPIVGRCLDLFHDAIADTGIKVQVQASDFVPTARGYEADLMAALLNIVDNAVHWLGTSTATPRTLLIGVSASKKYVRVSLSNNGPLIAERFVSQLFNPGFTLKPEGSGIGLAIAREAMRASKGDVAFDSTASETTFVIEMLRSPGG